MSGVPGAPAFGAMGWRVECQRSFFVKVYEGANIRNVVFAGHSHAGKTSLLAALLFTGGATPRLTRVDEGNTITDFDEEEVARAMSISSATAFVEWGKAKINFVDTPGFTLFTHEAKMSLPAAESVAVVVDGVGGVEVVTARVWGYAEEANLPRIIVGARMDRERADFTRMLDSIQEAFGRNAVPVQLPIGSEKNFRGVVDLLRMKAYTYDLGGNGKGKETDIPADMAEAAKAGHEKIVR
jgi:elongation factor G